MAAPPRVLRNALARVQSDLRELFAAVGEGDVHGYAHAMAVYQHARNALADETWHRNLPVDRQMAVLYAALLHDADDPKVFHHPDHDALPNARRILAAIGFNLVDEVCHMITLVSFSRNGNAGACLPLADTHGAMARPSALPRWMYIPRDADRLEALGAIGVARCVSYSDHVGRPLAIAGVTVRPRTRAELYVMAARMHLTQTVCTTTIDYFVAGLVPRAVMATGLAYFCSRAAQRTRVIEAVCLHYGQHGVIDTATLRALITADTDDTAERALAML